VRGLHIYEPDEGLSNVVMNGNRLTLGEEGIWMHSYGQVFVTGAGRITSSVSNLNIRLTVPGYTLSILSVISDNGHDRVGLNISGAMGVGRFTQMELNGDTSNTFTGDVNVVDNASLELNKTSGAKAVLGNAYIGNGARVVLGYSDQISSSSTVSLIAYGADRSKIVFAQNKAAEVSQRLHALVTDGLGELIFGDIGDINFPHGERYLYLDDLEIKDSSNLLVTSWAEGRDHLLVRRDSEHLQESLKRMEFEGYDPNAIHLVDYDKDYWEINAMPEPAAYGAGLVLGALGISYYRRRQRKCCIKQAAAVG